MGKARVGLVGSRCGGIEWDGDLYRPWVRFAGAIIRCFIVVGCVGLRLGDVGGICAYQATSTYLAWTAEAFEFEFILLYLSEFNSLSTEAQSDRRTCRRETGRQRRNETQDVQLSCSSFRYHCPM